MSVEQTSPGSPGGVLERTAALLISRATARLVVMVPTVPMPMANAKPARSPMTVSVIVSSTQTMPSAPVTVPAPPSAMETVSLLNQNAFSGDSNATWNGGGLTCSTANG